MCLFTGNTPLSLTETGWQFHGRVLWSDGDIFLGHIKKYLVVFPMNKVHGPLYKCVLVKCRNQIKIIDCKHKIFIF